MMTLLRGIEIVEATDDWTDDGDCVEHRTRTPSSSMGIATEVCVSMYMWSVGSNGCVSARVERG